MNAIEVDIYTEPMTLEAYLVTDTPKLDVDFIGVPSAFDIYHGAYSVTPTEEEQTLSTEGLVMSGNVTIAPIPNNYGRITWDGRVLTVS